MKFCPFRSTAEKEVECSKKCMLYIEDDGDYECGINHLSNSLDTTSESTGRLANAIWNNSKW